MFHIFKKILDNNFKVKLQIIFCMTRQFSSSWIYNDQCFAITRSIFYKCSCDWMIFSSIAILLESKRELPNCCSVETSIILKPLVLPGYVICSKNRISPIRRVPPGRGSFHNLKLFSFFNRIRRCGRSPRCYKSLIKVDKFIEIVLVRREDAALEIVHDVSFFCTSTLMCVCLIDAPRAM